MGWNCHKCGKLCVCNIDMCDTCIEAETVVVGSVEIPEAFELSEMFESASQYRTSRVDPGTYPIVLGLSRFDGSRYLAVRLRGTTLRAGYGGKAYEEQIGAVHTIVEQPYKYQIREGGYLNSRGAKITITDAANFERARGV